MTRDELDQARELAERWNRAPTSIVLGEDGIDALVLLAKATPVIEGLVALEIAKQEQRAATTPEAYRAATRDVGVLDRAWREVLRALVGE